MFSSPHRSSMRSLGRRSASPRWLDNACLSPRDLLVTRSVTSRGHLSLLQERRKISTRISHHFWPNHIYKIKKPGNKSRTRKNHVNLPYPLTSFFWYFVRLLACRLVANLHTLKSMLSPRAGFHTAGGPAKLSGGRPRPKDLAFTQPGKAPAKRSKYAWTWPSPCETNLGGSLVIPRVCSKPRFQ